MQAKGERWEDIWQSKFPLRIIFFRIEIVADGNSSKLLRINIRQDNSKFYFFTAKNRFEQITENLYFRRKEYLIRYHIFSFCKQLPQTWILRVMHFWHVG